jgi:hypothetical protein
VPLLKAEDAVCLRNDELGETYTLGERIRELLVIDRPVQGFVRQRGEAAPQQQNASA